MTQIDRIRAIIGRIEESNLFDIREIRQQTDFPNPSIRRALGTLVRSGEISRVSPGLFRVEPSEGMGEELDETFRRKFVSGLFYCNSSDRRQFFAVTYEDADISREQELLEFLENEVAVNCSELRENYGYSDDPGFTSGESLPIYPDIEGGEL